MLFGTRQKLANVMDFELNLQGVNINRVTEFCYLGVTLDEQLLWKEHIDTVCVKVTKRLGLLSRIRNCLTKKASLCVFNTLIAPVFTYVDVVWSELSVECSTSLQRLQNRAARIIAKCNSSTEAFNKLNWKNLETKCKLHKCILVYKCLKNLVPDYLCNYFDRNLNYHNYNTRRKRDLHLPQPKRNLG